jgi:hypothetical protein
MKLFKGKARRARERKRTIELNFERFEDRFLLAVFMVNSTSDTGAGSLRAAIQSANGAAGGPNTIEFQIPANQGNNGVFTITLNASSGALPPIQTNAVVIDGTTESAFLGSPAFVVLNGGGQSFDGLTLGMNSDGSTIKGLDIINFAGNAVNIQSGGNTITDDMIGTGTTGMAAGPGNTTGILINGSNNTIGGTAAQAGNIIAFNMNDAVHVMGGTGNAIRENKIFQNGSAIVVDPNANKNAAAVSIQAVASVPNLTTIDYTVMGSKNQAYTLDFFASTSAGSPAAQFLGTVTTPSLTSATQSFTATFPLATKLLNSQMVTATVTVAAPAMNQSTSTFASGVTPSTTPFVVTNTSDNTPGQFVGSLRQAILDSNNSGPGPNTISFNIMGTSPYVITVGSTALPTITVPVILDATTQSGFQTNGVPVVEIDGNAQSFDGLILGPGSTNSMIKGLDVANFQGAGIHVESSGVTISTNFVGTDISGMISKPGNQVGILLDNAATAVVGGTSSAAANTIGFNGTAGIQIIGTGAGDNLSDVVEGNFIGTNPAGGNLGNGVAVQIFNASTNEIGGTAAGSANTIGFNTSGGVAVLSGVKNAVRENTYSGANGSQTPVEAGDIGLGPRANNNQAAPVLISASQSTGQLSLTFTVAVPAGTSVAIDAYMVNSTSTPPTRVFLGTATATTGSSASTVTIMLMNGVTLNVGDKIIATATTVANGTSAFSAEVAIASPITVTNVGDSGAGSLRAAITAANASPGSTITFAIAQGTAPFVISPATPLPHVMVQTTIDATSQSGYKGVPLVELDGGGTLSDGLVLAAGSDRSVVEGLDIVGFTDAAIHVESGHDVISANYLGTDPTGAAAGPGNKYGVLVDNVASSTIGGLTTGAANLIGFNSTAGVSISGGSATGNDVVGNMIGANPANHTVALDNHVGVAISGGATNNTVGGATTAAANVIGYNSMAGVSISSSSNVVSANFIGTDSSGDNLGNPVGVLVTAANNTVGGAAPALGNVISFNGMAGVSLLGASAISNVVAANAIGVNPTNPTLNQANGVGVAINGGTNNLVGGSAANAIGFNNQAGVSISGAGATGNRVVGNFIGTSPSNPSLNQGNTLGVVITQVSGNTIGGTAAGVGNTIAFNGSDANHGAVTVDTGTANAIQQNLIYNNQGTTLTQAGIDLVTGGNNSQAAPAITGVSSVGGTTTISVDLTGSGFTVGANYSLDFFASAPGDSLTNPVQAHIYLGTMTFQGGMTGSAMFSTPLTGGQAVTATATSASGDTSTFAPSSSLTSPFLVTTTADSGTGSLRQAILNANADHGNTKADVITFAIPASPFLIAPATPLPTIMHPVVINATTQPGYTGSPIVVLQGPGGSGDGLVLASGSDGSTIEGMEIINFNGAGIHIQSGKNLVTLNEIGASLSGASFVAGPGNHTGVLIDSNGSNNTVGGTTAGAGNVIAFNANGGAGAGVDVASGSGNAIRQNSIFENDHGIVVATGANGNQAASVLQTVTATPTQTTVSGTLANTTSSATANYTLEFFASSPSDTIGMDQANTFLGSAPLTGNGGTVTFNVPLTVTVLAGQTVTATVTSAAPDNNTSPFSNSLAVSSTLVVNTTADSGPGSLRQAIINANSGTGTGTITFDLLTTDPGYDLTTNTWTIPLQSPLPPITAAVLINGTTQPGYGKGAQVDVDGGQIGLSPADGLVLGSGSSGSTIEGLTLTNFSGAALHVTAGSADTFRQNLIFNNASAIVLDAGTNNGQTAPTDLAASSIANSTTIDGQVTATTVGTYTVELYASGATGSGKGGPAAAFLGTTSVAIPTTGATVGFSAFLTQSTPTFDATKGLLPGQQVSTIVTGPDGSTSEFAAASATPVSPFVVTNTSDNAAGQTVGSLRQAILAANANPAAMGTDDITFALPVGGPFVISPTSALPVIIVPVTIDGTTQPGFNPTDPTNPVIVEINGSSAKGSPSGLVLGPGSDGSTITGLDIIGYLDGAGVLVKTGGNTISDDYLGVFPTPNPGQPSAALNARANGIGVTVEASNNTVGGTTFGAGNVIAFNTGAGVDVASGTGNAIRQNQIFANGSGIVLAPGANNNQPAPMIQSATSLGNNVIVVGQLTNSQRNTVYTLEFFGSAPGDPAGPGQAHVFLGSAQVTTDNAGTASFNESFFLSTALGVGQRVTATATSPPPTSGPPTALNNDTSEFAASQTVGIGLVVTTNLDNGNNQNPLPGSLRQAIINADNNPPLPGAKVLIQFNIDQATFHEIDLASPLPPITVPVILDGTTQPEYYEEVPTPPPLPPPSTVLYPVIEINGSGAGPGDGLTFLVGSGGSIVKGLSIVGFTSSSGATGAGIHILSNDATIQTDSGIITSQVGDILAADWIGVTPDSNVRANAIGVLIDAEPAQPDPAPAANNTIGLANISVPPPFVTEGSFGNTTITVNGLDLISGNAGQGILIRSGASANLVQNALIGTDSTGKVATPNGSNGIEIDGSSLNTVSATASDMIVLLSGNSGSGVAISGDPSSSTPSSNLIQNSQIGTDITGRAVLANSLSGVVISNSSNNTVGGINSTVSGVVTHFANVIGSNTLAGVSITGTGSHGNMVLGNFIGTNATDLLLANPVGVQIDGGAASNTVGGVNNTVGATALSAANVIGFYTTGVHLSGAGTNANAVLGNFIGTDQNDNALVASGSSLGVGVLIDFEAASNTIGSTTSGGANLIGFNTQAGVSIAGAGTVANAVIGNNIGVDPAHTVSSAPANIANTVGVAVSAVGNSIGGANLLNPDGTIAALLGNRIGYSTSEGILLTGAGGTGNVVAGNLIGADTRFPTASLDNRIGILIESSGNTVGGVKNSTSSAANVIGFNSLAGVSITGASATANMVLGNDIGTDPADQAQGNNIGVVLSAGAAMNKVGATAAGTQNLIGYNTSAGISITGATTTANVVIGNNIGVDPASPAIPLNNQIGVSIDAPQNTVGGTAAGSANIIGYNKVAGVLVDASADVMGSVPDTAVLGNTVGTDPAGDNIGNAVGVLINGSSGVTVGGTTASAANVIGFNTVAGVEITASIGGSTGGTASAGENLVVGNLIGTSLAGTPLGNGVGVLLSASVTGNSENAQGGTADVSDNTVGGTTASAANTIGFNTTAGVEIVASLFGTGSASPSAAPLLASAHDNQVVGNLIGTDLATIGRSLGNSGAGILITASNNSYTGSVQTAGVTVRNNSIGGSVAGAGNVVADNSGDGITIDFSNTRNSTTSGAIDSADLSGNTITGNLVSRNSHNGVHVTADLGGTEQIVQITHNLIGTNASGTTTYDSSGQTLGNGISGILLETTATAAGNQTSVTVLGNVISGNGLSGITLQPATGGGSVASVAIQNNMIGTDKAGANTGTAARSPFGNVLDGIRVSGVSGVTIGSPSPVSGSVSVDLATSLGNLIAGNLGRGIEIVGGAQNDTIRGNLIGVVLATLPGNQVVVRAKDANNNDTGNLSDGIFVLASPGNTIEGNEISANRGYGVHAFGGTSESPLPINMVVAGNFIGTNNDGTQILDDQGNNFGNGADGVFLDSVSGATIGGTTGGGESSLLGSSNVISGNHANGIDLLNSSAILITNNLIGTDVHGAGAFGNPGRDFGNASNGIFINQSNGITVGGNSGAARNLISGNHASGIFLSGTTALPSMGNLIVGNSIGLDSTGENAVPNAVAGIILSNADDNQIGGTGQGQANVISGNQLDGILLVNVAQNNSISGNLIGTDLLDSKAIGNSADGLFLLGSNAVTISGVTPNPTPSTISGNAISGNVISGNNANGIQIFGAGAKGNLLSNNLIGLAQSGAKIPNGADGVLLNNAGAGNTVGGPTRAQGNVIAGNGQSGVDITNTTTGTTVAGNLIGTDANGDTGLGNGGYGVVIYGSSQNTVGGATAMPGTGMGNVIATNALAGVQIFGPTAFISADHNLVAGNLIGTNPSGKAALGNRGDGIEIYNGSNNTIGGATTADRNIISGNANNGVLIFQFPTLTATGNQIIGNFIGTDADGDRKIPNTASGVQIIDGGGNSVGGTTTTATALRGSQTPAALVGEGNLISGNGQWGIQIILTDSASTTADSVLGNYIGTDLNGGAAIPNGLGGVLVNNLSLSRLIPQTIGGSTQGAGNLVSGNANVGIELIGPQNTVPGANNVVQGNVVGLTAGNTVLSEGTGVSGNTVGIVIDNSPGNTVGGSTSAASNVISGNSQEGVEITGVLSTANQVAGNLIGTDLSGTTFPSPSIEKFPAQFVGVLINVASANVVGGSSFAYHNVISGNAVGVQVSGLKQNTGAFIGSGNTIANNLIGTDTTGTAAVPNLDLGVFINNSPSNVIGPGNFVAANGIAGVEIFAEGSTKNIVMGNSVGTGINGTRFAPRGKTKDLSSAGAEAGIPIFSGAQLNGVVIIGASQNVVGASRSQGAANTINGNVEVGVYITNRDFTGRVFSTPVNNAVSGNTVKANGIYGILLYNAPNNPVRPFTSQSRALIKNSLGGESIAFRNFLTAFDRGTSLPPVPRKGKSRQTKTVARKAKVVHRALLPARPRVPALFNASHAHSSVVRPRHGK